MFSLNCPSIDVDILWFYHMCMDLADIQLIVTGQSCEVKGCDRDDSRSKNSTTLDGGYSIKSETGKRHTHPQNARQPLVLLAVFGATSHAT